MLRTVATLTVGLLWGASAALAADMPVKAPLRAPLLAYPYEGSGFYFGLGTFGEAQSTQVNVPVIAGPKGYAAGAGGSVIGGYQRTFGASTWIAAEVGFNYANTGINSACGALFTCSIDTRLSATQKIKLGGPLSAILDFLPSLSTAFPVLPPVPAGTNNTAHPYVMLVAHESREEVVIAGLGAKKMLFRAGAGAGLLTQLKAGMVLDTWAEVTFRAGTVAVAPGVSADAGGQARAGMSVLW